MILNLHYQRCELTVTALNSTAKYAAAAKALGISKRTLDTYVSQFNIRKAPDGKYMAYNPPLVSKIKHSPIETKRKRLAQVLNSQYSFFHVQNKAI